MKTIVFQLNNNYIMSSDNVSIYDSYSYTNWYSRKEEYVLMFSTLGNKYYFRTIKDLINNVDGIEYNGTEVAIGSIEFVENILNKNLKPINIPNQLMDKRFTGRWIANISKQQIVRQLGKYDKLFVKDAMSIKRFDPIIVSKESDIEFESKMYFVSEYIDIVAEWRAFVLRGKILDCRQYIGNYNEKIDDTVLRDAIDTWTNSPSAYTIDLAKTKQGKTVIIEAHNFISCGLYGFEQGNKLAVMSSIAYNEEKIN